MILTAKEKKWQMLEVEIRKQVPTISKTVYSKMAKIQYHLNPGKDSWFGGDEGLKIFEDDEVIDPLVIDFLDKVLDLADYRPLWIRKENGKVVMSGRLDTLCLYFKQGVL